MLVEYKCKKTLYLEQCDDDGRLTDRICTIYTVDKQIMEGGKPDWCPLRELPEKIPDLEHGYENVEKSIIRTGWNACLDAIAKE